jgi:hypothetical protein
MVNPVPPTIPTARIGARNTVRKRKVRTSLRRRERPLLII